MPEQGWFQRFLDWLNGLFGGSSTPPAPQPTPQPSPPSPQPTPQPPVTQAPPLERAVLLVIYNPRIPSEDNRTLLDVMGWNSPALLAQAYAAILADCSGGVASYHIADTQEVDSIPLKADGYQYTSDELLNVIRNGGAGAHNPDLADYNEILTTFNIPARVSSGEIDEVWMFAFPYGGFYESRMAGPGAFTCNSPALNGTHTGTRRYVLMGFNPERGVGEMLESFGHRCEDTLRRVYRFTGGAANLFERFERYDLQTPGLAEVGSIHYAPNSQSDYEWGNQRPVPSRCDTWLHYPDLSGAPRIVNCADWGGGDIRAHHVWWLRRLPHVTGQTGGINNNWWGYVIDPNMVV